jgi:hypothetical protein
MCISHVSYAKYASRQNHPDGFSHHNKSTNYEAPQCVVFCISLSIYRLKCYLSHDVQKGTNGEGWAASWLFRPMLNFLVNSCCNRATTIPAVTV